VIVLSSYDKEQRIADKEQLVVNHFQKNNYKNIEKDWKKELLSYFLNFNANFAAIAQDITVNPIGNIPLVSICGTCSNAMLPEEYIAAATGKATSPTTPSFVFVFSETFCCMLYVLIVII
jgi:hypothetical protein